MSNDQKYYGCLVRVSDINRVRSFYRDTLELGDPIIDSNFWLEFHLPGTGVLAIEQSNTAAPGEKRQDMTCLLGVNNFDKFMKSLETRAVKVVLPEREVPGRRTATVRDPEGNLVTLYAVTATETAKNK